MFRYPLQSVTRGPISFTQKKRTNMAALDWSQCPAVESVRGKMSAAWVFRGTRMPVSVVFENLEDGITHRRIGSADGLTRDRHRGPGLCRPQPGGASARPVDARSL
jgi:uncharacterized protein (DUF433 family)